MKKTKVKPKVSDAACNTFSCAFKEEIQFMLMLPVALVLGVIAVLWIFFFGATALTLIAKAMSSLFDYTDWLYKL